jgi:hypothetical protein
MSQLITFPVPVSRDRLSFSIESTKVDISPGLAKVDTCKETVDISKDSGVSDYGGHQAMGTVSKNVRDNTSQACECCACKEPNIYYGVRRP